MFNKLFRRSKTDGGKKEKSYEERGHREPIIVKIFRDDGPSVMVEEIEEEGEEKQNKKPRFESNRKYFIICVYALGLIATAALLVFGIFNIGWIKDAIIWFLQTIAPFIAALMIGYVMSPLVNLLEDRFFVKICKLKKPKIRMFLSVIITYVVILGVISLGLRIVIPQVTDSITDLVNKLPKMYEDVSAYIQTLDERFPGINFDLIENKINESLPEVIKEVTDVAKNVLPKVLTVSFNIVKGLFNTLLAIALSIYIICDKRRLARMSNRFLYAFLPVKTAKGIIRETKECGKIFGGFIIGKAIDSLIIGILCFIAMSILKLPYAVLLSVIVGVTNMIPFFGPFIGAVPGILLYLCIDPVLTLVFSIMIFALQQFDGWVLGPLILGDSTNLRPLWVIFGITVGGAYLGVLGMFLGVPVTAVVAHLMDKLITSRLRKKKVDIT